MKKLILFDYNGTIIDDNDIWFDSIKETFRVFGGGTPPTVIEWFHAMEKDYMDVYKARGVNNSREELNSVFQPHYNSLLHTVKLFPGVIDTLQGLKNQGFSLGLITLSQEHMAIPFLEKHGLSYFFEEKFSRFFEKNKAGAIEDIVKAAGIDKTDCFYVGDAPSDVKHSNHAGVKSVAFLNGFTPEDLVLSKNPIHVIRKMSELLEIV